MTLSTLHNTQPYEMAYKSLYEMSLNVLNEENACHK